MATPALIQDMRMEPIKPVDTETRMIELASSPNFNPETFKLLVDMMNQNRDRFAVEQFNAAMSLAQAEMRPIAADANNPQTRSKYARYGAIDKALRPIYTKHGFALSFNTADSPITNHIRVVCEVTHSAGASKTHHVDMPADGKGAKGGDVMTLTHAAGAGMSYGMRYLVKMIFNVAVGEDDRDGNEPKAQPKAPKNYDDLMAEFEATADDGYAASRLAFEKLPQDVRTYALRCDKPLLERIKAKAQGVDKQKAVKQ